MISPHIDVRDVFGGLYIAVVTIMLHISVDVCLMCIIATPHDSATFHVSLSTYSPAVKGSAMYPPC